MASVHAPSLGMAGVQPQFRVCPRSGLQFHRSAETLIKLNAVAAVVTLLIGGVLALLIVLTRWQAIHLIDADNFYLYLTAHGLDMLVAQAQELAGDRTVEVAAGDVGGQMLAAGLVDEVRMDVAPVVLGSGKRYFGSVDSQHLLEDPDVVQGNRVIHLCYRVGRRPI